MKAGIRVGLRTLAPVVAGAVAVSVMYGSPMVVVLMARSLFFPPVAAVAPAVLAVLLTGTVAATSVPRLTLGLAGWIRHLPATAIAHRRSVTAGLAVVQMPVLAIVVLGGLAAVAAHSSTAIPRLLGILPLAWASSLTVLRVRRGWTRALSAAAAVAAWVGSWWMLLAALGLLGAAEALAGPLDLDGRRQGSAFGPGTATTTSGVRPPGRLWLTMARRALGWKIAGGWAAAVVALVPAVLFIRNNTLLPTYEVAAMRLAGVLAIVLVTAVVSESLFKLRPPWPWVRSLPWSAARRAGYDAALLGVAALPVVLAVAAIESAATIPVLLAVPIISLRGAAAIREAPSLAFGAAGLLLTEGSIAAALVSLLPWTSLLLLALTPVGLWLAAERERRQDVSRWHELHHLAAGDSISWSDA